MDRQFNTDRRRAHACGVDDPEGTIAVLAARQHGVVARRQLLHIGLTDSAIDSRVRRGRLRMVHRGVYLIGPVAPPLARPTAAVLACGEGAVVGHQSAAALWSLGAFAIDDRPVDVTVVGRRCGYRPGIRAHHVRSLERDEATTVQGIPITTPARTLLDLASAISDRELEAAVAEAERRRLTTERRLLALIARYPRRPGTRALRRVLERGVQPAFTRSRAEERFLALIRGARLDPPEVNTKVGPYEVDFLWREEALIVEVDGFAHHSDRAAFERDRRRDAELAARGYTVIRVTWRQLIGEPAAVVARVAQALVRAGRVRSA